MGHQRSLRRLTSISALPPKADTRIFAGVRRCGPTAEVIASLSVPRLPMLRHVIQVAGGFTRNAGIDQKI
jgi:hypothetical protein